MKQVSCIWADIFFFLKISRHVKHNSKASCIPKNEHAVQLRWKFILNLAKKLAHLILTPSETCLNLPTRAPPPPYHLSQRKNQNNRHSDTNL